MDLKEHYNKLYLNATQKITAGQYELDKQIDAAEDDRRGITLLIKPSEHVKQYMQLFLNELKAIEPAQYYYPGSDIHITVLSIISCYSGFNPAHIAVRDYVAVVNRSILAIPEFKIRFQGITASAAGVMIQGFPEDKTLCKLRDELRRNFKNSELQQSIDSRYSLFTAHATVMRFREPLNDSAALIKLLEKYRQYAFGTSKVSELELVSNDWYQRERLVEKLHTFSLSKQEGQV